MYKIKRAKEFLKEVKEIKADFESKYDENEEFFDDGIAILERTVNPSGANSQRKNGDEYGTFIKYADENDLEDILFRYYSVFGGGYDSMITHCDFNISVWWIKRYVDDIDSYLTVDENIIKTLNGIINVQNERTN